MAMAEESATIIGAGPAGLSAAIELARHGVHSTVIDGRRHVGGAVFRQPDAGGAPISGKAAADARALLAEFDHQRPRITETLGSEVVGCFPESRQIVLYRDGELCTHAYRFLILSTGCHERAQPFSGWTLPGVMGLGGMQTQVKRGRVRPGRVAIVGTGPLMVVAAKEMHQAGMDVVGVFEARGKRSLLRTAGHLLSNPALMVEGLDHLRYCRQHKIPLHFGYGVVAAKGRGRLEELVVAPYTEQWRPVRERSISLRVDCAAIGYGFVPRTQVAQMLRCAHGYDRQAGGYRPVTDGWQRTSVRHVYAAGDNAGVHGSPVAMLEGRLAALACLADMRVLTQEKAEEKAEPLRRKAARIRSFHRAFEYFSHQKPGMFDVLDDDCVVCRCEGVTKADLDQALDAGALDINALKLRTRIGMGECQGKMCSPFCSEYLVSRQDSSPDAVGMLHPRFPLAPIPMAALARPKEQVDG
jgi:hydrogen cyanide synthase HcnB